MKTMEKTNHHSNHEKFADISEQLRDRIEDVLETLEIEDYIVLGDRITFPCPVHGGDSEEGCSVFIGDKAYVLNWKCFTHHCELDFGTNIFGFIRGVLQSKSNDEVKHGHAISWAEKFLNYSLEEKPIDEYYTEKKGFAHSVNTLAMERSVVTTTVRPEEIRKKLQIPSEYYLKKGYSNYVLDRYDVGECFDKQKPMYNRVVVPVYDDNYDYMVGCVGRTLNPKCCECGFWHQESFPCPTNKYDKFRCRKWINSKGFKSESYFYNYWFARSSILEKQTVILVEGQGDVWRIVESGFDNVLGLFGTSLTDQQKLILEKSGALNIVLFTDPDEAGKKAAENIRDMCGYMYNFYNIKSNEDPGDLTTEQIKELLLPILKKIGDFEWIKEY